MHSTADDPAPSVPRQSPLSEADSGPLQHIAYWAPKLTTPELRILLELAALATPAAGYCVRICTRALATRAHVARSSAIVAIDGLTRRGLLTTRKATARTPAAYQVNLLITTLARGPNAGPPGSNLRTPQVRTSDLTGPIAGPIATDSKGLPSAAASIDDFKGFPEVIGRVVSTDPMQFPEGEIEKAKTHLHAYMKAFGSAGEQAEPPDDQIAAEFLAVATWAQLFGMLRRLRSEGKAAGESYAWFVTVAMQRIRGVKPSELAAARRAFKAQHSSREFTGGLVKQLAAGKGMRR
jgi:hypothetical protein